MTTGTESRPPIRVEVASARGPYDVVIGAGLLADASTWLAQRGLARTPALVSTPPIWRLQGDRVKALAGGTDPILMADGERAKTLRTVTSLLDAFAARRIDRTTPIVAFGGGVVGDTAGFAAAAYLRGVPLVQVPTTLLAQVDSSIGGKVGVNLPAGKNLAGAFYPPSLVLTDLDVLATLPRREFRAGLYEVVKYGVIASTSLFDQVDAALRLLLARDVPALLPVVVECARIKAGIVARDEREDGPRRVLNFGHTIGHALETVTKFRRLRHGEAVGYGMLAAARLSVLRGLMPEGDEARIANVIRRLGPLPVVTDLKVGDILEALGHDKKIVDGRLHFVLCAGIGRTETATDVTHADLTAALAAIGVPA